MRFDEYPYDAVAFFYDELASLYSLGRIPRSKASQLAAIAKGDRVLYAGVGRGADAVLAARFGADVTAIDLSASMLLRCERRFAREGLSVRLIRGDVADHVPEREYDVVVANYFLNLYDADRAGAMLRRLAGLVRRGGLLMLADFARPSGGRFARALSSAYYRPVNTIAWALGFCALHPILDYAELLAPLGFRIRTERRFPVLAGRNPAFVSIVAERVL
jgi:demethylmenaquinone methyltransferase/2-methoxy-6-polyprenyl-1,4-benzoquinol methylase